MTGRDRKPPAKRTLDGNPGPDLPLVLRVLVECPDDDRLALAEALRKIADDVESGISNERGGFGVRHLEGDFSISFGTLDGINDILCRDPDFAGWKVADHRVGEIHRPELAS